MTANSALSQNWVGCTVRTPNNPGRVHIARAMPMLWALLRAQQAGRAHVACAASACSAQVASIAPRSCAHVATSLPCPVKPPRSRHRFHVATSWSPSHVATSHWCRDLAQPTQVTTPEPGRDLLDDQPMSRHRFHVATSFLPSASS